MAVESGAAFLLKLADTEMPEVFRTVAGLRTTQMSIAVGQVVVTNKGSGGWQELLPSGGVRSVSVSGAGVFTGSEAELALKTMALSGSVGRFELSFEGGERSYTLALESSGPVVAL